MATSKRIVCLANSRKLLGRCIAGREWIEGQGAGAWVRPVSARENREVSEYERQYEDGSDPRVLDIVDVPVLEPLPNDFQTENWLLNPEFYWRKVNMYSLLDLDDLAFFLGEICGMEYIHLPSLAPTGEMLGDYRKGRIDWSTYQTRFINLMRERRIEDAIPKDVLCDGCLLCSEDQPHQCHRRLIAEYLNERWGGIEIEHLGMGGDDRDPPQTGR